MSIQTSSPRSCPLLSREGMRSRVARSMAEMHFQSLEMQVELEKREPREASKGKMGMWDQLLLLLPSPPPQS